MRHIIAFFLFLMPAVLPLSAQESAQQKIPQNRAEITLSFAPLVKKTAPAVVNIYAKRVVETAVSPFAADPFFRDFFRGFESTRPEVQNSLGSGVILTSDGIIVSNFHVVAQATDIRVVSNDGREYDAAILLSDEESDLAILKITSDQAFPFLELRESDTLDVGELVLAIGNPFGVGQTVSSGIVSGLARSGTARGDAKGYYIQTDAPINPGNSGGALVDIHGNLIGVNTSILTRSGGSNGIGFAIPASLVRQFVSQAFAGHDRFIRPWAGLNGQAVTFDLAQNLGLDIPRGVIVNALHPQSPFLKAGLKTGDVIIAVDDVPVASPAEMLYRLSLASIGTSARVSLALTGKELNVKLIEAPNEPKPVVLRFDRDDYFPELTVSSLNPAVELRYGLPWSVQGFVVVQVGRAAASIGVREGDIIQTVNGIAPKSAQEIDDILRSGGRRGMFGIQRGAQRLTLRFRS